MAYNDNNNELREADDRTLFSSLLYTIGLGRSSGV